MANPLLRTKSVEQSIADTEVVGTRLKKQLTAWDLTIFGVAVVIGVISSFVLRARAPQRWALMGMDRVEATDGATEIDGTSAAPTP